MQNLRALEPEKPLQTIPSEDDINVVERHVGRAELPRFPGYEIPDAVVVVFVGVGSFTQRKEQDL